MKPGLLAACVSCALATTSSWAAVVVTVVPATLPLPIVGEPYALQFGGGSGRSPHAFFVTFGRLPSNLLMASDGLLAGTPAAAGPYAFNLVALDADGRRALVTYSGEVDSGAPVALPQSLTVLEDQALPITFSATDVNDSSFTFAVVEAPEHGILSGSGELRSYQPVPDYFGGDDLQYTASDALNTSAPALVSIAVQPVNDAPSFVAGPDIVALRTGGAVTRPGWASAISVGPANEAAQLPQFVVTVNTRPTLFALPPQVEADGTLSFTPSGVAGNAVIGLELRDDGGTANGGVDRSAAQFFAISLQSAGTDLSASIEAPVAFVDGAALQFSVRIANAGPSPAIDAEVDVLFPPQLTALQWTCAPGLGASCGAGGNADIADGIDVPANGEVVYNVAATIVAGGASEFDVTASVAAGSGQEDPDPSDDTDQHRFRADAIFSDGFED